MVEQSSWRTNESKEFSFKAQKLRLRRIYLIQYLKVRVIWE